MTYISGTPEGGSAAIDAIQGDDTSRLFDAETMAQLHYLHEKGSPYLADWIVSQSYDPTSHLYQARRDKHRRGAADEAASTLERLCSAGTLVCYFRDLASLDVADELMQRRLDEIRQDPLSRELRGVTENGAWLDTMVGKAYFNAIDPATVDNYLEVILVNGHASNPDTAERVIEQAYMELRTEHTRRLAQGSSRTARRMRDAIDMTSLLLVERFAKIFDEDPDKVLTRLHGRAPLYGRAAAVAVAKTAGYGSAESVAPSLSPQVFDILV